MPDPKREFPPAEFGAAGDELKSVLPEDYIEVGRLICEWAEKPETRPKSLAEFNAAVGKYYRLPDKVKAVQFVQSNPDVFILRLPEWNQLSESRARIATGGYQRPFSVTFIASENSGYSDEDVFYARVADYTMRQCR